MERLSRADVFALDTSEVTGYACARHAFENSDETSAPAAMDGLRRIVRSLRNAEADSEVALGVTSAQLFVLRAIAKAEVLTVGDLARYTATAQSSVSEVVARLLARGLVSRRPSAIDRRRAELSLSETGRALLANAPETIQERLLGAFGRLRAEQQQQIAYGLQTWITEAGLGTIAPTMFFEPSLG
jgi:DNA-binding MarR family transcriptional regulator